MQDIDTGGRATLPVPGAVLEPPVPEASGCEECKMATEVSNVHAGRGRTDNRPAYSWLGARRAGKRFPRSMRRASKAGAGTTSRFLGSDRKPCEPVATNCTRPPDPSLTSDKVNRSKCFLSAIFLSFLIIFPLFFCNFGYHCKVEGRMHIMLKAKMNGC